MRINYPFFPLLCAGVLSWAAHAGPSGTIRNASPDDWILTTVHLGKAPVAVVHGDGSKAIFKGGKVTLKPGEELTFEFLSWGPVKPAKYRELEQADPGHPVRILSFAVADGRGRLGFGASLWVPTDEEAVTIGVCLQAQRERYATLENTGALPRLYLN